MTILRREELQSQVHDAVALLRSRWDDLPGVAIVCGSGMNDWLSEGEVLDSIPYADLPAFAQSRIVGHNNTLLRLRYSNTDILVFSGRSHLYEGTSVNNVVLPTVLCYELGIRDIVLTNAAGGLHPEFKTGDMMVASDLINFSPHVLQLFPQNDRQLSSHNSWALRVRKKLAKQAWLRSGVYCSVSGPSYETRAEIAMFSRFADAIGMSTVLEAQCALQLGMRLVACSLISNTLHAPPTAALSHEDVVAASHNASSRIAQLMEACCQTLQQGHAR